MIDGEALADADLTAAAYTARRMFSTFIATTIAIGSGLAEQLLDRQVVQALGGKAAKHRAMIHGDSV